MCPPWVPLAPPGSLGSTLGSHQVHARLPLEYAGGRVWKDTVSKPSMDAYQKALEDDLPAQVSLSLLCRRRHADSWHKKVAAEQQIIVFPLAAANACLVSAYSMLQCKEVFAMQSFSGSLLTSVQRAYVQKYPATDFEVWVQYGSWSFCHHCGSFFFNDEYFRDEVYREVTTSEKPCRLATVTRQVPDDPVEHKEGSVGVSSRWWYLPGMYKPKLHCGRCVKKPVKKPDVSPGKSLAQRMIQQAKFARQSEATGKVITREPVSKTGELYIIPRIFEPSVPLSEDDRRITWPRYNASSACFDFDSTGESMLELSKEECLALRIVILHTEVKQERYGASHQLNWKKVGLSRAYFKKELVTETSMPTEIEGGLSLLDESQ